MDPEALFRFRAKKKRQKRFYEILPESQGQIRTLTVLSVPYSLHVGTRYATDRSGAPDYGGLMIKLVLEQSIFPGQLDFLQDGRSPPSGIEVVGPGYNDLSGRANVKSSFWIGKYLGRGQ